MMPPTFVMAPLNGRTLKSILILTSLLGAVGCSSTAVQDAGRAQDATTDIPADLALDAISDAGQTCSPHAIWTLDGLGFTYSQSGGLVQPPVDAGCDGNFVTYQFSVADKILAKHACSFAGPNDATVNLTEAQSQQIISALRGLATSCPGQNCGADYPSVTLTVMPSAAQPITYSSDFYAGCQGAFVSPPFISYQSLGTFATMLESIVTSACQAGDGASAGASCTRGQPDAGQHDSGVDGRSCTGTAPNCFGNNTSFCCGNDPSGIAVCTGGAWMCGAAAAPGCNGMSCIPRQDAATGS